MRTRVFRILAGVLAVLLTWWLVTADHGNRPFRELAMFCALPVLFAGYALFGTGAADRFMAVLFGTPHPDANDRSPPGRG